MAAGKDEKSTFTVRRWTGGVVDTVDPSEIEDNELVKAENVDIDFRGIVKVRRSQELYTDMVNADSYGKKRLTMLRRYRDTYGTKRIIGYTEDGYLVMDADDGKLVRITGTSEDYLPSSTPFCSFAQCMDTLFISSDKASLKRFNEQDTTKLDTIEMQSNVGLPTTVASAGMSTGKLTFNRYYYYLFTFDIYSGDDFLGETAPICGTNGQFGLSYFYTTTVPARNVVSMSKRVAKGFENIPSGARYINIYRTDVGLETPPAEMPLDYAGYYYLDSISVEDYLAADYMERLFLDYGYYSVATDKIVDWTPFPEIPKARFICWHKNRLWYGNVRYYDDQHGYDVPLPSRVFFSNYKAPAKVLASSWEDLGPAEDEITGLVSWNNDILLVFKHNSVWAIVGADDEIATGVPDIRIICVDQSVGCIAPNTICHYEGTIVWLSNHGPYYYDGSLPKPLKPDSVRNTFDKIPTGMKYRACGIAHTADRSYLIALSDGEREPSGRNNAVMKFEAWNGSWTKHIRDGSGISAWCEVKRGDEEARLLAAVDADSTRLAETGSVVLYDFKDGPDIIYDAIDGTAEEAIPWEVETKAFDLGRGDVEKQFNAVDLQFRSDTELDVDLKIDEWYDTRLKSPVETVTISQVVGANDLVWDQGNWDQKNWAGRDEIHKRVWVKAGRQGRRISVVLSGESAGMRTEIHRVSVEFMPKERMGT